MDSIAALSTNWSPEADQALSLLGALSISLRPDSSRSSLNRDVALSPAGRLRSGLYEDLSTRRPSHDLSAPWLSGHGVAVGAGRRQVKIGRAHV